MNERTPSAIERHYSPQLLAELLSVHPETLRRLAARGELRSVRVGADRRYPESAVREYLARTAECVSPGVGRLVSIDRRRTTAG